MGKCKTSHEVEAVDVGNDHVVPLSLNDLALFSTGTFSNVYRGTLKKEGKDVQIVVKKTWSRENRIKGEEVKILKLLNRLNHKNVVRLLFTFDSHHSTNICHSLVFEFLPMTLYKYLKDHRRRIHLTESKMFAWQMFRGLHHLDRAGICHRDLKPMNLLVDPDTGFLKISDFGSSTLDAGKKPQPSYHVTRYYRPPELLLGSKMYGRSVDVWSGGCVLGEMLRGAVLFPGHSTENQFEVIVSSIGLPSQDELQSMKASATKYAEAKRKIASRIPGSRPLPSVVPITEPYCNKEALSILQKILIYNPQIRLCGTKLLLDPFWEDLFNPNTRRPNGQKILCLNPMDRHEVLTGDTSMTGSHSGEDNTPPTQTS